jgi:hypothetical protein
MVFLFGSLANHMRKNGGIAKDQGIFEPVVYTYVTKLLSLILEKNYKDTWVIY